MCNTTFLNHKDYKFKVKDFDRNITIKDQVGEIYVKESNFNFIRNWDSTFVVISSVNGAILDTLKPFTIEKERKCLINDGTGEDLSSQDNDSQGTEVIISLPPPLYKISIPEANPSSPLTV